MYTRIQPILYVEDVKSEKAFYEKLGFAVHDELEGFVAMSYGSVFCSASKRRRAWMFPALVSARFGNSARKMSLQSTKPANVRAYLFCNNRNCRSGENGS